MLEPRILGIRLDHVEAGLGVHPRDLEGRYEGRELALGALGDRDGALGREEAEAGEVADVIRAEEDVAPQAGAAHMLEHARAARLELALRNRRRVRHQRRANRSAAAPTASRSSSNPSPAAGGSESMPRVGVSVGRLTIVSRRSCHMIWFPWSRFGRSRPIWCSAQVVMPVVNEPWMQTFRPAASAIAAAFTIGWMPPISRGPSTIMSAAWVRQTSYTSFSVKTAWSAAIGTETDARTCASAGIEKLGVGCSMKSGSNSWSFPIMRIAVATSQASFASRRRPASPITARTAAVASRSWRSPRPILR